MTSIVFRCYFRDGMIRLDFIIDNHIGTGRNGAVLILTPDIKILVWWVLSWQWLLLWQKQIIFRVSHQSSFFPRVLIGAVKFKKADFLEVSILLIVGWFLQVYPVTTILQYQLIVFFHSLLRENESGSWKGFLLACWLVFVGKYLAWDLCI